MLQETGSYEETKKKTIEVIDGNPNVICELDVYGEKIDKKKAELLAGIIYYGKQHRDNVHMNGNFKEEEIGLIEEEYRNLDK